MAGEDPYNLTSYDYALPEEAIARFPLAERDACRLLVLRRDAEKTEGRIFRELGSLLPPGALLVVNDTKTFPARICYKRESGAPAEFLLLTPPPLLNPRGEGGEEFAAEAECLLKPARRIRIGDEIPILPELCLKIMEKGEFGKFRVLLRWRGDLTQIFYTRGQTPLPPYLRREPIGDEPDYQTVYAREPGAVAAPTAGLHFTSRLRENLKMAGFGWAEITLHVGYGTFSPVRAEDIRLHKMHAEYARISPETAQSINDAKAEGRAIIAVGTTSFRALEGAAAKSGLEAYDGWIDSFFYPGAKFSLVDGLITNFHLPKSSLLMLVSAFAGREKILNAYATALASGYRFFSYGDAMLIL